MLAARQAGWAPIQYEGRQQEAATYRDYREVLKRDRLTGVAIPEEAVAAFF